MHTVYAILMCRCSGLCYYGIYLLPCYYVYLHWL